MGWKMIITGERSTSKKALVIGSLVFAYLAIPPLYGAFQLALLFGAIAIILGVIALIKKQNRAFALLGIFVGSLAIICPAITIFSFGS